MSFDNIGNIVQVLSEEPDKLSENEMADLYIFLTSSDEPTLAKVENSCNRLQTNSAKLRYLRGLLEKSKPESEQPTLSKFDISDAITGAMSLFDSYSQDLVNVAKNEYNPYSYFEASEKNIFKQYIDEKSIPIVNGQPNLLLHNLPEQGEEGLTDYDSLKNHIKENLVKSDKTIILGTSGCGKTRLCLEALCHNYGLYLVANPYTVGCMDLEESARWTKEKIEDKQSKEAERIADLAVTSCIVGRLFLLQHLFGIGEQHNITMAPKSWLIFQLDHTIIRELCSIFREVTDLDNLRQLCSNIMKDIKKKFTDIFPIVYDEAQSHTIYLPETFPSALLNQDRVRPFFSVVVKSLSRLSYSFTGAFVCITGSGLSLLRAKDEISARGKAESHVPTFNQFGRIDTSDELFKLVTRIFPIEEEYVLYAIKWLKGRYRWSWAWIHYLIISECFNPQEVLDELVVSLTTSAESLANKQYSIYTGFTELEKHPSARPVYVKGIATLELMKRVIISYAMTGKPVKFTSTDEMDIMNLGFAHIKNIQKYTSIIDEPLVIQAGYNFFESKPRDPNDLWFQLMSQVGFNAAMPGIIWEKCVVNFLREKIFNSNMALSGSEMFKMKVIKGKAKEEAIVDFKYLPDDFKRPPQLLPYGDKCLGRTAVESTTADDYLKWLREVAEWKKTGNVSKDFCPICYPPNTAGPDISIAFRFPVAENDMQLDEEHEERKSYILNVQVKLRKTPVIKQSFKTVELTLMFIDKNGKPNPPGVNDKLKKIYKEQGWFERNMKMIVVFPCSPKRKSQYQQTLGASSRKQKIPRVIIDTENASILFSEVCQEWIKEFKEKTPDDWDCSDIEDEKDESN